MPKATSARVLLPSNARHHLAADRPKNDTTSTVAAQVHGDVSPSPVTMTAS